MISHDLFFSCFLFMFIHFYLSICTFLFISVCFSVSSKYICVSIGLSVCLSVSTLSLPFPLYSLLPYLLPFPRLSFSRCLSISVCLSVYLISPQPSFSSSLCLSPQAVSFTRYFSLFVSLCVYPLILSLLIPLSSPLP